jgi:histidyl-tRNA synthetase
MSNPSVPKGTRDFSSESVLKRDYIIETIKKNFILYGYEPLQTSSLENLSTLTGKYGEEGDQLIFKILNSGDYLKSIDDETLREKNSKKLIPAISDKALRYDLTVPFARYVVQNQHEISFPFKRFQIQPVWRADRPQKGRFREFYQCDADVVGSSSLWQEVEFVLLYDEVFSDLNLSVELQLNNRKILSGLAEVAGIESQLIDFTVALDKLDKIGEEKVKEEMRLKGISEDAIQKLSFVFIEYSDNFMLLDELERFLKDSEMGKTGINEVRFLLNQIKKHPIKNTEIKCNLTLARGLNYYTGMIFEAKSKQVQMGSIGGGGRYDDLTGIFGLKNISGVGISFGLDRIYLVLEELNLFPKLNENKLKILFLHLGKKEAEIAFSLTQELRKNTINAAFYPDESKLKKQLQYADKKQIPFVAIIGEEERKNNQILVKNMKTGEQINYNSLEELVQSLR